MPGEIVFDDAKGAFEETGDSFLDPTLFIENRRACDSIECAEQSELIRDDVEFGGTLAAIFAGVEGDVLGMLNRDAIAVFQLRTNGRNGSWRTGRWTSRRKNANFMAATLEKLSSDFAGRTTKLSGTNKQRKPRKTLNAAESFRTPKPRRLFGSA